MDTYITVVKLSTAAMPLHEALEEQKEVLLALEKAGLLWMLDESSIVENC